MSASAPDHTGASQAGDENLRLIRDSAGSIAPPGGSLTRIRALRFHPPGFDRAVWAEICAMGWPGLRVAEADGGSGLGMAAFCTLAEELGAGLVPEPLIGAVMAARVLQGKALGELLSGSQLILPAWQESAGLAAAAAERTVLSGGRVSGRKLFVVSASGADAFLVSVRGGLALVARDAPGLALTLQPTQDGGHFATLDLQDTPAIPVAGDLHEAIEEATLALAAYLLGVMQRAFAITLDYLRTRQQFGRPIGSFQSLQHRAADLSIQVALTRASVEAAAAVLDGDATPARRQAAVSQAKARAGSAALLVTRQAIQLHGGIGYTDEADIGLFLRKAMVLANLHGAPPLHRARYAALMPHEEEG